MKIRNIEIGILGSGEVVGMCEIIFDMPSYMQSVKCSEDCDVYFIFKRSYDRLVAKRNPNCIKKMKENVHMKLVDRNNRLKNTFQIDLYRSLQYKIELSIKRKSSIHLPEKILDQNKIATKGPLGLIQMDLRSKTAAYERIKRQHSRILKKNNKMTQSETEQSQIKVPDLQIETNDTDSLIEAKDLTSNQEDNTQIEDLKPDTSSTNSRYADIETSNEQALKNLEQRIKRWHLDFGCKKVSVTKLNRIDIDVRKNIIF